jgi:hypothetical protein
MDARKLDALFVAAVLTIAGSATARADGGPSTPTKDQCIAANGQAQSLRREGKFAQARAELATCVDPHCPKLVSADCASRLDELDRAQPTVLFDVKDAAGHDLASVRLDIDGQPATAPLDGTAIAVDPGQHTFRFQAEGQPPATEMLVIQEQEKGRREHVTLGTPAAVASSTPASATEPVPPPPETHSVRRTVALVVGGVGVAGVAAGAVFGILASSAKSDYEAHCGSSIHQPAGACDSTGISGHQDASTKATLSTAFFVGGGVLVAAGAVVFFTAPKAAGTSVGVGPGSVTLAGRF